MVTRLVSRFYALFANAHFVDNKFENIQKLDGHHGEVWALAVSHRGNFVVTGSHDKSIRVWEKLDEPVRIPCCYLDAMSLTNNCPSFS
jgi:WD40 repeat protein